MTDKQTSPTVAALRKLEASFHLHWQAHKSQRARAPMVIALWRRLHRILRRPFVRRSLIGAGGVVGVVAVVFAGLWLRLASGPIEIDLATPWLTAAIEENFGAHHKVKVGGTQLERDDGGRIQLRIRDIVVSDAEGVVVASAPKAEVGFSGLSLLAGRMRAVRLSLVGAEMAVRIETGGKVTVFAGADKHPIATASATAPMIDPPAGEIGAAQPTADATPPRNVIENFTALLTWIDSLGASGLDGHDLAQLGLKSGSLVVDDQRNGKRWSFENINLGLTRPKSGGIVFSVGSENEDRPWSLSAAVTPSRSGRRVVNLEARRVSVKDLLLALRVGDAPVLAEVPISASLQAEIAANGATQALRGRVVIEEGLITDARDPEISVRIDRAEFNVNWDVSKRVLTVPFQVLSGANRLTLFAHIQPPLALGETWNVAMTGGTVLLGSTDQRGEDPLIFNRINLHARIDPGQQRITLEQGDLANVDTAIALTGSLDFSEADPRLAIGLAGTRMKLSAMKRLWPFFVAPDVRSWVEEHITDGAVERLLIATNAPISTFKASGPPLPDDGLSVEIATSNTVIHPVETLPLIREADLKVRVTGRTVTVNMGRGSVEMPSGRKLTLSNATFEVPDMAGREPPSRTRFRVDGSVQAAADLLVMERLRDFSGMPFDLATARGSLVAQVALGFPIKLDLPKGSSTYTVNADIAGFAGERMIVGQKVEAATLRINASHQGYEIKGDVKIGGTPAALEYRKQKSDAAAEIRIQATLDEATRAKLGFDVGYAVSGPIPIKLSGQVASGDRENRFNVETDLTQARIDNLLPGWAKVPGKAARANFKLVQKAQTTRFEDITIDGSGTQVKGTLEVDASGDIIAANFPVFSLAEGDKASFKVDRGSDGALRVTMRGDVYDGRGFIKAAVAGSRPDSKAKPFNDLDLDIRLGAVVGFHGETVRGVELRLSRRGGNFRTFALNAKLGRDAPFTGELRGRGNGRPVIYVETKDAGALFRFTDSYPRMVGGQMWVAMDSPTAIATPQEGLLNISDFAIRGEGALDRVVSGAPTTQRDGVKFSRMRAEFTRTPGRLEIREGVVQGNVGATVDGQIDYLADEVHLRGSFVPLYKLNNMLGQLPIVGYFLGGGNEGLLGVTYEVVGPPGAPRLNVNPLSAVAPGLLRKFFEYRNTNETGYAEPRP
jgi:hypothetical protein